MAGVLVAILILRGGSSYEVTARFQNAGQLVPGNLVQLSGTKIGTVEDIAITPDGQADITVAIDEDFAPLRQGTRAIIKQASLSGIANRFVDLQLGSGTAPEIADGGRIGIDSTVTAVELDEIFNLLDPVARVAVQDFFKGSARMLRGKGDELRAGVRYLNPALSTGRRLFGELTEDEPLLRRFLVDSAAFSHALAQRREDLSGVVENLNTTTEALGNESGALAQSVGRLPAFLRTANTTFVNLRSTLDEVDPLVEASEPVAKRLGPFLAEARRLASATRPTVRDLSRTIGRPGRRNDLIEYVRSFPPLARTALDRRQLNGASRRGAFPEMTDALRAAAPNVAFARPYTNDFLGWFDDFSTSGAYDALGGFSRASVSFSETLSGGPVKQGQFRRCPGAAEEPADDGSNVFSEGEQRELDCDGSLRAPGPAGG